MRGRRLSVIVTVLAVTACGVVEPPDAGVPLEDVRTTGRALPGRLAETPTGPHVELITATVAGQDVEIVMQRDGAGTCMAVRRPPASSTSCGGLPGDDGPLGSLFGLVVTDGPPESDPSAPIAVAGLVTPEVSSVAVELEDGSTARAAMFTLAPAEVEGSGFVVYLPADARQRSLLARDEDGVELARLQFSSPP